ncbi:MAG: hypothetical protein B6242_14950 [Anaerolineaceae bacterium 4572_78]|nr:MAG: hypothetical protein B6242_14950 [Anaerolineaceae bacterium 4572_78]
MPKAKKLINGTNPYLNAELKIPRYNGGLFDSEQHVFFVEKYVGDKAFVKAIRLLRQRIFDDKPQNVDYAALGVRQLGSIYEGLLEYQPQFIPSLSDENREKTIELITDKGERKATGSYYTPEYIVQYIVENTLDPLIEQIRQKVKRACKTAQTDAERHAIEQSFGEHVLALKILDPAMGSGHFLVAAADYLTMAIVTDPYMAIDDNFDSEMMAWKRRVVENCLYGVDKNALAVELAKLSLWISTIAHDKPLNFLDHHLRHGDSLIGANLINLKNAPPMLFSKKELAQRQKHVSTLFDSRLSKQLPTMLKQIHQIMNQTSDTYDDVLQKDSTYRQLQIVKKPFIALADMWISAYFENTFSVNDFDESMQLLDTPHAFFEHASIKNIMDSNQLNMGRKHDFFHWQLEFPEAFFDKHGQPLENAGFDAVIGNPPYGAKLSPHDKTYIKQFYTCTGSKDTAEFMFEKSMLLGKYMIGMIIPKALAFYSSWHAIRDWLINRSVLQNVCDVGIAFADANYEELIIITSLHVNTKIRPRIDRFEPLRRYVEEKKLVHKGNLFFEYVRENGFIIFTELDNTDLQILQKIRDKSIRLHDISENTFRGLYISDAQKKKLKSGHDQFVESVPVVKRYQIDKMWHVDLSNPKWQNKIRKIKNPRIFFKVMRGNRLICNYDLGELITTEKLVNVTIQESSMYDIRAVTAIINTPLPSFFIQKVIFSDTTETSRVMDAPYSGFISIPKINFTTPAEIRHTILESGQAIYHDMLENFDFLEKFNFHESAMFTFIDARLQADQTDVIHDMLAYLAEQMMTLNKEKQQIAENFWLDMEGMVNESTFKVLRNKGKRKSTLAKKTVFQQFINAKSHATCKLDNTLAWNEKTFKAFIRLLDKKIRFSHVVAIYRDYAPDYRQCVQKIIMTDQLIDHIVYQLYGLTESEIAVVQK